MFRFRLLTAINGLFQFVTLIYLWGSENYFLGTNITSFSLKSWLWPTFLQFDNLEFMNQPEKSGSYAREKLHVTNLLNQWFENLSENRFSRNWLTWRKSNRYSRNGLRLDRFLTTKRLLFKAFTFKSLHHTIFTSQWETRQFAFGTNSTILIFKYHDVSTLDEAFLFMWSVLGVAEVMSLFWIKIKCQTLI